MSASSSSTAETTAKERSEATASIHRSHAQALNSPTTSESIKGAQEQSELVQGNSVCDTNLIYIIAMYTTAF